LSFWERPSYGASLIAHSREANFFGHTLSHSARCTRRQGSPKLVQADVPALAALFESGEAFVTAWYGRIVRRHQLIWAVAIVALVNIDTLDIAQNVWAQSGESNDRVRELPVQVPVRGRRAS
jgi:hypothetical protein